MMKSAVVPLGLLLTVVIANPGRAQTTPKPPASAPPASVEQQLVKLEHDMIDMIKKGDATALAPLLADDFMVVTPAGELLDKAAAVGVVKSGEYALESLEISDVKVRVYGDTAVVTYLGDEKSTYKGQDVSGQSRSTDVFIRRGGKWQQVSGQSTSIPPGK